MHDLLAQIERAEEAGLYYLALMGALVLPDMCGALGSPNGQQSEARYEKWVMANLGYSQDNARRLRRWRGALLHQGRLQTHEKDSTPRLIFVEPGPGTIQLHGPEATLHYSVDDTEWTPISVQAFCGEIVAATRGWLDAQRGTQPFERNLRMTVSRHAEGLGPFAGVAVIG